MFTARERDLLKDHAHIKQIEVNHAARKLASAAELLRISLGANPDSYKGWRECLDRVKKDIECIEGRCASR